MNEQSQTPSSEPEEQSRLQAAMPYIIGGAGALLLAVKFPSMVQTAIIFVLVLSVLVFVHEWGHYQFARWGGMKVNRFGIGFPPWIFTVRRNNIDYSIGALPIGGMVDIAGLGSEEEMVQTGRSAAGIGTAGTTVQGVEQESFTQSSHMDSYRYRNPEAPHGTKNFQDAGLGWRFWTLFAGPLMNFLFAIVAFILIFSIAGVPDPQFKGTVESVVAGSPAQKAGVQGGDVIVGVNGKKTPTNVDVAKAIRGGGAKPTTLDIERTAKGAKAPGHVVVKLTPVMKDVDNDGKKEASIGVAFDQNAIESVSYVKVSSVEAVKIGFLASVDTGLGIVDMVKRLFTRQLSSEEVKSIGGPVKIAQATGQMAKFGPWAVLLLAAKLSVNLGLINLLPLPALDGGRIMFLGYEFVMRRPVDPRKEGLVHMAGMVMLLLFMLLITFKDVISLRG